jgi:hypothetical protein
MDFMFRENREEAVLRIVAEKMLESGARAVKLLRIFNPQVTTIDGKIMKVQVPKSGVHVIIEETIKIVET